MFGEILMEKLCKEIKDRFFKLNLTYICMYNVHTNPGQEWFNMDCYVFIFFYRSIKSSFKKWDALSHFFSFSTHLHAEKPFFGSYYNIFRLIANISSFHKLCEKFVKRCKCLTHTSTKQCVEKSMKIRNKSGYKCGLRQWIMDDYAIQISRLNHLLL